MKLPTEVARNHTPIINPPIRAGASTVMALRPTGLSTSSPMVCRKYVAVSHIGLASTPGLARRRNQDREAEADEHQSPRELGRRRRLLALRRHPDPDPRHHRREQDQEERVHRLEPAAREIEAEHVVVGVAIGEQVQGRSGLFEHRPEQRRGEEQHANHVEPLALLGRPFARGIHPAEESDDDDQQEHAGGIRDLRRGYSEPARCSRRRRRSAPARPGCRR